MNPKSLGDEGPERAPYVQIAVVCCGLPWGAYEAAWDHGVERGAERGLLCLPQGQAVASVLLAFKGCTESFSF